MRYCSNVTAGVIQYLNQLPLRELDVGRCNIDDDCLAVISGITSIRVLNISDSQRITSSGLNCLVKLRLTKLTVRSYCRPQIHPTSTPPTRKQNMIFLTLQPLLHMESEFNSDESGSRRSFWPYFYKKRHFLKKKMEKTIFGH